MAQTPRYPNMPIIVTKGDHYDIGYNIGCTFHSNIKQFYQESLNVQNSLEPFYHTGDGRDIYETYLRSVTDQFPQYINEMKGLSEGCGISFEKVFLLNISKEVYNYHWVVVKEAEKNKEDFGCTDVMVNRTGGKFFVHNEDCDPKVKPYGYLVQADIRDPLLNSHQKFTAYSYPGFLPGTTFGFNSQGLVMGVNGLYPNSVNVNGTPRIVLNRHMLSSKNKEDAMIKMTNEGYGCAFGFNVNFASTKDAEDMWAIEVCNGNGRSRTKLTTIPEQSDPNLPCHYVHANHYLHLDIEEVPFLRSTRERGRRAAELTPPRDFAGIFNILGDTKVADYPLYRTPRDTDPGETVATAAFDILGKRLDIYMENPKFAEEPFFSLPLY